MGPSFPLPNTLMQLSGILISQSGPYFPERKRMSSLYFRVFNILIVRLYRKDHVPVGSTRILETKILVGLEMPERNEEPGPSIHFTKKGAALRIIS